MAEHWHGLTLHPPNPLGVIQPELTPQTDWSRARAKREMARVVRAGQGRMRYSTPDGRTVEPADWWLEHEPLQYVPIAEGGMVAVMPCTGDCIATAAAFVKDFTDGMAATGLVGEISVQTDADDTAGLISLIAPTAQPGHSYPRTLPPELARWHCWIPDGGHSIIVLPEQFFPAEPSSPAELAMLCVPAPVKMVQRLGYRVQQGFVVSPVPYESNYGLAAADDDEEW